MLDAALAGGYALAAVNVTSSQTLNAALRGFDDAGADGIVQITTGGAGYLAGGGGRAAGARGLAALAREVAADLDVHVALHTDHCPPAQIREFLIPLMLDSRERHARGEPPLFNSHMFDGSTLPLEDNLKIAAGLLDECHAAGVVLEVECGVVGARRTASAATSTPSGSTRRGPAAGRRGARDGSAAATCWRHVRQRPRRRPGHVQSGRHPARGQEALERRPGARFSYVFHGSSGHQAEASYGVVKVNVDTDAQYAFTRAVADHMLTHYEGVLRVDGGVGDKGAYDPRAWGLKAEAAMAARVAQACRSSARRGGASRSATAAVTLR